MRYSRIRCVRGGKEPINNPLNTVSLPMAIVESSGVILWVNAAFCCAFGYSSEPSTILTIDEVLGEGLQATLPDVVGVKTRRISITSQGGNPYDGEVTISSITSCPDRYLIVVRPLARDQFYLQQTSIKTQLHNLLTDGIRNQLSVISCRIDNAIYTGDISQLTSTHKTIHDITNLLDQALSALDRL